jgi:hypothetical protein
LTLLVASWSIGIDLNWASWGEGVLWARVKGLGAADGDSCRGGGHTASGSLCGDGSSTGAVE